MERHLRTSAQLAKAAQRGWVKPGHKYVRRFWDSQNNRWRYEYYEAKERDDHGGADAFVHALPNGRVAVATEYDPKLKDKLKGLGGKWDPDSKSWTYDPKTYLEKVRLLLKHVVYHPRALDVLEEHLPEEEKGEAIQKDALVQRVVPADEQDNLAAAKLLEFADDRGVFYWDLKPGAKYRWEWEDGYTAELAVEGKNGPRWVTLTVFKPDSKLTRRVLFEVAPDGQMVPKEFAFWSPKESTPGSLKNNYNYLVLQSTVGLIRELANRPRVRVKREGVPTEPAGPTETPQPPQPPQGGAGNSNPAPTGAVQPYLLEPERLPLYPDLEPEPKKPKPRAKGASRPQGKRKAAYQPPLLSLGPVQPALLEEPLTSLAKALGYRPGVHLTLRL